MTNTCAAFWKHTNIRGGNNIYPCCRFKHPVAKFDGDLHKVLHSPQYQSLRDADALKLSGCSKCAYEESIGKESLRQKFNNSFDMDSVALEFLEIGFDNICNLTCDGCYSEFSSSWSKKLFPHAPKSKHYTSINEIHSVPDSIKKVVFLGGEPLMTSRHKKFLDMVKHPNKVSITYNTNATFMLTKSLIKLLKTFKDVHFIVSIDGYKELNDKVRSGSKWSDILKFIDLVKRNDFSMSVNSVLHLNNWHGMADLEQFVNTLNVEWHLNILTYPEKLDINNYRNKQEIIDSIKLTNIPNKNYILKHLITNSI